jgi:small redox-active disulfide protein 2
MITAYRVSLLWRLLFMDVRVLGSGCANCRKLQQVAEQAIAQTGVSAQLSKVEDFQEIMRYGVMATPALVVDEKVVSVGKIPDVGQVSSWLTTAAAREHGAG